MVANPEQTPASDKVSFRHIVSTSEATFELFFPEDGLFDLFKKMTRTDSTDLEDFKNWFESNRRRIIYKAATLIHGESSRDYLVTGLVIRQLPDDSEEHLAAVREREAMIKSGIVHDIGMAFKELGEWHAATEQARASDPQASDQ